MSEDHVHDEHDEEVTVAIGVQFNDEETVRAVPFGGDSLGILIEVVDHGVTPANPDDGWEIDPESDFGMKVSVNGFDPDTAAQFLRAAAETIEQTEWEEA